MNFLTTFTIYLIIVLREYIISRKKMKAKEKAFFIILSVLSVLSSFPASEGMDFDTVGSSLSGMISLFMH